MAENVESTILDVKLDAGKVAEDLQDLVTRIAALKAQQKSLNDEIKAGNDVEGKYAEQLIRVKDQLSWTEKQAKGLSATTKLLNADTLTYSDSLNGERQKLADMQKAYDQLDRAQRESEGGKAFLEAIQAQSDAVKELEESTGRAQRSVGDYPKALQGVVGTIFKIQDAGKNASKVTSLLTNVVKGGATAFVALGTAVKTATLAVLRFLATPIGAIIAAVAAVLATLVKIMKEVADQTKKNDDASTSWAKLMAVFKPIIEGVTAAFDKLATAFGKVAEKIAGWIGGMSESVKAAQDFIQAQDDLEEAERQYTVNSAQRNKEIAALRAAALNKEKFTRDERIKMMDIAMKKERENLEDERKIKNEQLRLLIEQAEREKDTSDETANKIAQARAAAIQADTEYFEGVRRLQSQRNAFIKEEEAEDAKKAREKKEAEKKALEEAKKAAAVRLEIARSLEDALIEVDTDEVAKRINKLKVAGEREVENLRIKLKNLKQTDLKGREDLSKLIVAREKQTQQEIEKVLLESAQKRADALRQNQYAELELLTSDSLQLAQFRKAQAKDALEELENMTEDQRKLMYENEEAYDAEVLAARKRLADETIAVQQETYERQKQAQENEYQRQLQNIMDGDAVALATAELARAQETHEQLINMDAETKAIMYKSQEDYEAAIIASENNVTKAKKKAVEEQRKMAIDNAAAIGGAMDALSGLLSEFGEENEAAAKASKAIALGKIAVDTGTAIAAGVAQAQSVPFPANIAAIATTVATVLANMASAVSTVKEAKFDAGKFAGGGTVPGTSYTGDRLIAHVNSGEGIYTGTQANNLLQEIANNPMRGGVSEEMTAAFAAAVASLPAPVTVLTELREFGDKVSTFDELARI